MSYDQKCHELAKAFLEGEFLATENNVRLLAQEIQDTIEDFLKDKEEES